MVPKLSVWLMAGIGIYFEKYYLENSIAILQKPESLYWFECPQKGVKLVCVS
jgi:hypothetical protein